MNRSDLARYLIAVLLLGLKPGPTVSSVIAYSLYEQGTKASRLILGILSANIVLIAASGVVRALGLGLPPSLRQIFSTLGAVSLFFLGTRILIRGLRTSNPITPQNATRSEHPAFIYGFLLHVSNPNTILFFSSVFLAIVPTDLNLLRNVCVLGSFALIVDGIILFAYSYISSLASNMFQLANSRWTQLLEHTPVLAALLLISLSLSRMGRTIPESIRIVLRFFHK